MREPIRKTWIWWVLGLLTVFNAPWYLPAGSIEPFVFGLPYWVVVVGLLSVALAGFLSWVCVRHWNILEDEEEGAAPRPAAVPDEGSR